MSDTLPRLLEVARQKNKIDQQSDWFNGSETYLDEIRKELIEVEEELSLNRRCYLEEELGDVLWDYLNILLSLEKEKGIDVERVFQRSLKKFGERIEGIQCGKTWASIKQAQKKELAEQYRQESELK